MDLTLEEAFTGVEKKIKVPRNEHCTHCNGSGSKPGTKLKKCETCGGQGQVIMSSGFFRMQQRETRSDATLNLIQASASPDAEVLLEVSDGEPH